MEKKYAHSFFSKVYLGLKAMELKINEKIKGEQSSVINDADQKLRSLLAIFQFRSSLMDQWKNTLGLLLDASEEIPKEGNHHPLTQDTIRKAWSYMLSAQITLEFYQHPAHLEFVPEGFQSGQYLRSIEHFIHKKTKEGINHYHLVLLLHMVLQEKGDQGLEYLHFCLAHPLGTLHYLLFNTMMPIGENENLQKRLDQMHVHRNTFINAYQKPWNEFIIEKS